MTKFIRYRFSILGGTALAAAAFVGGTVAAAPLSRLQFEIDVKTASVALFILSCLYIALHQFRPR